MVASSRTTVTDKLVGAEETFSDFRRSQDFLPAMPTLMRASAFSAMRQGWSPRSSCRMPRRTIAAPGYRSLAILAGSCRDFGGVFHSRAVQHKYEPVLFAASSRLKPLPLHGRRMRTGFRTLFGPSGGIKLHSTCPYQPRRWYGILERESNVDATNCLFEQATGTLGGLQAIIFRGLAGYRDEQEFQGL